MIPPLHGFLVIDKPAGYTSRDVVDRIQGNLPRRTKLGHTGTLDPFATGTLVLCLGHATRLADRVQALPKQYTTRFRLGVSSDTDDLTGTITSQPDVGIPTQLTVENALGPFRGRILQTPSQYSAVKVGGERAHRLARAGAEFEIAPRPIEITELTLLDYTWPTVDLRVRCSKGTYIRSLARDLGQALGCGAYAEILRRDAVGPFVADGGLHMESTRQETWDALIPMSRVLDGQPRVEVMEAEYDALLHGRRIPTQLEAEEVAVMQFGALVAFARAHEGTLRPSMVFPKE
jgi:tRNA pseudouridine55 synthase